MQKAYQSQRPISKPAFLLTDILKGLDKEEKIPQLTSNDFLGNYSTNPGPRATDQDHLKKAQKEDFKEFDFLKDKKPKGVNAYAKPEKKRRQSPPKSVSTKEIRSRTMERIPQANENLFAKIKGHDDLFGEVVRRGARDKAAPSDHRPKSKSPLVEKPTKNNAIENAMKSETRTKQPETDPQEKAQPKNARMTSDEWDAMLYSDPNQMPDLLALLIRPQKIEVKEELAHSHSDPEEAEEIIDEKHNPKKTLIQTVYERNKEFLEKKKEKLRQIEKDMSASFKPKINKKSIMIDKQRGTGGFPRYESLHGLDEVLKQREQDLKEIVEYERYEKFEKEELANCTFKPKINSSYTIREPQYISVSERNNQWTERKKSRIETIAMEMQKQEMKDCTFKPKISKRF
jgi:hypothetical protein